jgi:hypothetical protein
MGLRIYARATEHHEPLPLKTTLPSSCTNYSAFLEFSGT